MSFKRARAGFTLIEMMIAMTILSFISLAVYQNTTQSFELRENVEQDGDFYNSIRVALDVLGRDVIHMYSPQAEALPGNLGKAAPPAQTGQTYDSRMSEQATKFWGEPINKEGVKPSRFQGEGGKITFVTNSHMRLFRDTPESVFAKVTYQIAEDKLQSPGEASKVLVKLEDTNVFEDKDSRDSETEVRYVLLTGLKSIEFEFLDGEKDRWEKRWDTSGIDHKNVFPAVIKITIELLMPKGQSTFKISQEYRPELPI